MMDVQHAGTQPSTKGPQGYFTGMVRIDPFSAMEPSRTAMIQLAIQETLEGTNVDWLELVTDEQYVSERQNR